MFFFFLNTESAIGENAQSYVLFAMFLGDANILVLSFSMENPSVVVTV